ncbi:uncharacterized protein LY79DRAFT_554703 [Colletotrichum navitas]|uniref:Uncharacterized protein n=1 Tax=Colletotrichum navitas TaxID=681940 RepID=A0AAD8PYH8_9PEZI|nr:uncharacterized protein LY79DRAFT_554703 [Colletotrichum navitas]KAK1590459.1 hypothetical protein LY79DRAFT_554703 [Colletotrichum navitas]
MRIFSLAIFATAVAVAAAAGPVQVGKRQLSECVLKCMDDLGIYDGHAISLCRQTCGERP